MTPTPPTAPAGATLTCTAVAGVGEVVPGDDLAELLLARAGLQDGDLLVVTSKVVSKAEGRVATGERADHLATETARVVARRGSTSIVRTRHGLVMAAAGIDASNTAPGTVVLLPVDPDASARRLRDALAARGVHVGVLVTDTAGRAWRNGQTDIAVGAAGIDVLQDYEGRHDPYGNALSVTAPAVADEVAAAADLVKGKLAGTPAAVVRGLGHLLLGPGLHGPGARALVRAESQDMFGYGAREAVRHAVLEDDTRGFGGAGTAEDLLSALTPLAPAAVTRDGPALVARLPAPSDPSGWRALGRLEARLRAVACAHGWRTREGSPADREVVLRFTFATP
jgi:coenzyme F420-0:L-glutamate ligase/coenzyme F420-1:gamma-L-glutamate ligase